ncbi:Nif3-like dinuclear metal center hexameric protein [Haloterrigena sp. SYSU A558-1]|uniref:Nif3-like dinuclear metal center hexameric protein n=1 Tax=Haloterrigena gelatinilytica TaxID=2741724 RepID=A0A8J8GHS2_9EURY|nr:Nif3-like dinuclear metal center hexameric protein [Haloterrigena gelatinilytica]NUB89430.1 Nif3-like dinuclear metal center hexameric protein [Haloterrigena gelatinilytica]NUC70723.1 Nif3-like dinuclear metal center hexameric protein [Haloterrigena gelatinilytica]
MNLSTVVDRLDEELRIADYADLDASANGLQIGPDEAEIERVAVAVDGVRETFDRAIEADADLLVVHHGLSWGGFDRVTGRTYDRIAPLIENDLALYVAHLPLDGHQELGNAAGVADVLDLADRTPFGELGPEYIGQRGTAAEPYAPEELQGRLERELETDGRPVQHLAFGPDEIEDVAIVTGSGVDWLDEAVDAGADALVTGEGKQKAYHEAKEAGIHVFLAGHYATETFGVRSLQELVEEWGLETSYLEVPTGL